MSAFFGVIGFLSIIVGIVMLVIALFRKKPKKTAGIVVGAGFALFIIGLAMPSSSEVVDKGEERRNEEKVDVIKEEDSEVEAISDESKEEEKEIAEQAAKEKAEQEKVESEKKDKEKKEKDASKKKSENAKWFKTAISSFSEGDLELQDVSYNYIVENNELFPAVDDTNIIKVKELTDSTTTIKHLNKNANPHFEKVLTAKGTVVEIEEDVINDGQTVAFIHILDDDFNSHLMFILKDTGDILEDDIVQIWGVPVGPYSFENISGGHTNAQMYFGSHLEKK